MNEIKDREYYTDITISEFLEFLFLHVVPLDKISDFQGNPIRVVMPFWRKKGLVPFIEKGKWVEISFAELIWLRILDDLRSVSFPIDKIKNVVDYFFMDAYDEDLPRRILEYNKHELEKIKLARPLLSNEHHALLHLEHLERYPAIMHAAKLDVNYLTQLVVRSLTEGKQASILIFKDGQVVEKLGNEYQTHRKQLPNLRTLHLELSITHYLEEFIESEQLSQLFLPKVLNANEEKVIREMKNRKVRQITIYMHDGEVKKIESKRAMTFTSEQWLEVKKILGIKNYEKIEVDAIKEKEFIVYKTNKKL